MPKGEIAARIRTGVLALVGIALLLLLPWQLAVLMGTKAVILPPISKVVDAAIWLSESNALVPAALVSLFRVNVGFAIAVLMAVPLGFILGRSHRLFLALEPLIEFFRFVIPFAWIPIAILWFGVHEAGKIFIIWYAGFFIVLLHAIAGVRGVDPDLIKAAKTLGASERLIFRKVVFPAAIPTTMTGLRLAFATCWIALIAAEMVAARSGLGFMIMDAREFLQTNVVIFGMILIGAIGVLYNALFEFLEGRIVRNRAQTRSS